MNDSVNKDFLRVNSVFFIGFFLFSLAGMVASNCMSKESLHLLMNRWCTPELDQLFKWITLTGTTYFVILILIFIVKKVALRDVIWLAFSLASAGGFGRIIKFFIFKDVPRPLLELKDKGLYIVSGCEQNFYKTFPSGHTQTAFCFFLFLSTLFPNRWLQLFFIFYAILIAFSRVYLSQHFVMDTVGGAWIGIFFTIVVYYLTRNLKKDIFDKDLISLFRK